MNLLTADNFEVIKEKIKAIAQEKNALEHVINTIIEKAWNEKKFASIYAKLCQYL